MSSVLDDVDIEQNLFDVIYPNLKNDECSKYFQIEQFNQINTDSTRDLLLLSFNIKIIIRQL